MPGSVLLTAGAERDLIEIFEYVAEEQGERAAQRVLDRLLETGQRLKELPERGSQPRELVDLGIREFRQIIMKPYRIIYRVLEEQVIIVLIADGRRDMQSLLARRLLGA